MVRTLSGGNSKSDMSPDVTNNALMDFAKEKLESEDSVTLIHDPSDIRKPYSTDLEDIGYVRSLDNQVIASFVSYKNTFKFNKLSQYLIS